MGLGNGRVFRMLKFFFGIRVGYCKVVKLFWCILFCSKNFYEDGLFFIGLGGVRFLGGSMLLGMFLIIFVMRLEKVV